MSYREEKELITYLINISTPNNESYRPSAMPEMRRALLKPENNYLVYKHLSAFLPDVQQKQNRKENRIILIATLFAYYNTGKGRGLFCNTGNMGNHLYQAAKENHKATERRFEILLDTHFEDLPDKLFSVVAFLRSKERPINWKQLQQDIKYWDHPEQFVQKNWAQGFWGSLINEKYKNSKG